MAATRCSEPCAERGAGPCAQAGRVSVAGPVVGLVRCAFILLAGEAMALNCGYTHQLRIFLQSFILITFWL